LVPHLTCPDCAFPLWGRRRNSASVPGGYDSFVIPDVFDRTLGQGGYERKHHRKQGDPENDFQNDRNRGEETHGFLGDTLSAFALRFPVINPQQFRAALVPLWRAERLE